jgi:hypothetical protein
VGNEDIGRRKNVGGVILFLAARMAGVWCSGLAGQKCIKLNYWGLLHREMWGTKAHANGMHVAHGPGGVTKSSQGMAGSPYSWSFGVDVGVPDTRHRLSL